MDNPGYCKNAFSKLQLYTTNGILPSVQLITTYETMEYPLDAEMIENIIQFHFLSLMLVVCLVKQNVLFQHERKIIRHRKPVWSCLCLISLIGLQNSHEKGLHKVLIFHRAIK